jgi:signal transduction histidine kinase/CheY-like chemotaxis protein/streptogramin lyase
LYGSGPKGGGLNKFDQEKGTFSHYRHKPDDPHSLSSDSVFAIREDREGMLWIGTDGGGLNRMNVEKETFTRYAFNPDDPRGLKSNDIWSIHVDSSNTPWIGTLYGGLNKFNRETGKFTHYLHKRDDPKSISSDDIWAIYEDRAGVLWIGTENGLNKFDRETGTFTRYYHQENNLDSLSNNRILCIYEDSHGVFWIGTLGGGLNKFDRERETFTRYTEQNGLPNNVVYGILEEDPSTGSTDYLFWFSTNLGLVRFNPRTGKSKSYNKKDGLQSNEFNAGAYCKNKNGEMFFGGINGFNYFHPQGIKDNPYIPPVVITQLQVFNETVEPGKRINGRVVLEKTITETTGIKLSHDEEVISFKFAALHYSAPRENQYAYRMVGIEDRWNNAGDRRFATYTGLPPGDYTFQVKASNNDGVWNEEGASLKITIVPPFWRTGWFYFLCALAVLFLGLGIHRLRVRDLKKQERKLTRLVKERTQELEKTTEIVQTINAELIEAKEKAEKERQTAEIANRCKSDFLARMSHEIRTPMNSIIGFADLVLDTSLSGEQGDFIKAIKQSGEILLDIINEILDLSRIEAGQLVLEPVEFDPKAMLSNICELVTPRVGEKPIKIFCRTSDDLPVNVKGDAARFRQVLINLMGNAVKFTRQGEIELVIHVGDEDKHRVKLHTTVRDTGIGIPGDKQDLIFDAFQQVDVSDTRQHGGTGLGLSISKHIARLMGGDIRVESETGKGSTFHFTAWMEKIEKVEGKGGSEPDPAQQPVKEKAQPSVRILMAEDNPLNRKLARFMLNKEGYRLDIVNTGKEAVEKFFSDPGGYDLILMDIQMPEMDGKKAARLIRKKGFTQVPIIALTAASMKGDREKCMKAGMNDYISKPIKKEILFEVIKKWLPAN